MPMLIFSSGEGAVLIFREYVVVSKPISVIKGFHAHVYYSENNKNVAKKIREEIGQKFAVRLGQWHDEIVGPHLSAMYLVVFGNSEFNKLVPWLMLNRDGLSILVHPETGNDLDDHTKHALWLGEKLDLNLEKL